MSERDRRRDPFAAVHLVAHWKFQGPVARKQDPEVDAVNLVINANERQLASRFRDADEIDTQPEAWMVLLPSRRKQEVPLGVPQERPARGGVPVVLVEKATEGTGTDVPRLMKDGLGVWIEKQAKRRPKAALLVSRERNGNQAVCQNVGMLPERL